MTNIPDIYKIHPTEKTKRKQNKPCKHCGEDCKVGERYISTMYNDGFTNRPYGCFHIKCWDEVLEGYMHFKNK